MPHNVKIKRIYEEKEADDGYRVLVDRIWPRGVSKKKAQLDEWMKNIAPSNELRKWFGHNPEKFPEFKRRYKISLAGSVEKQDQLKKLKERLKNETVTLLYSAKDERHNQAVVLKEILQEKINFEE